MHRPQPILDKGPPEGKSPIARVTLVAGLLANAVVAAYVAYDFLSSSQRKNVLGAITSGVAISALAIWILARPNRLAFAAARGIAGLVIAGTVVYGGLMLLLVAGDPNNRGVDSSLIIAFVATVVFEAIVWIAALFAEPAELGTAIATTMAGAVGVLGASAVLGFFVSFFSSFLP